MGTSDATDDSHDRKVPDDFAELEKRYPSMAQESTIALLKALCSVRSATDLYSCTKLIRYGGKESLEVGVSGISEKPGKASLAEDQISARTQLRSILTV